MADQLPPIAWAIIAGAIAISCYRICEALLVFFNGLFTGEDE